MKSLTTYNLISWFTLDIIFVCVYPTLCWFVKSFSFRIHTSLYQPTYHHLKNPRQRCSKDIFWIYRQWFILILPVLYIILGCVTLILEWLPCSCQYWHGPDSRGLLGLLGLQRGWEEQAVQSAPCCADSSQMLALDRLYITIQFYIQPPV